MINNLVTNFNLEREAVINLLPFILSEIRNYTNQYFLTTTNEKSTEIQDKKIYVEKPYKFSEGDIIEIINSENNTGLYIVKNTTKDYIEVYQNISNETNNMTIIKLSFKGVNLKTISDMISYSVNFAETSGIQSQSLGGYSVSYSQPSGGETIYPLELYGGLNSLKKLHDDFAEYRRKGYVRL